MSEKLYKGLVREDGKVFVSRINTKRPHGGSNYWVEKDRFLDIFFRNACDSARKRSRSEGLSFNLSPKYLRSIFPEDGVCPVFGTTMPILDEPKKHNKPSLDRICPELGYVEGNVAWISLEANRLKNNASLEQLEAVISYMKTANDQEANGQ